MSDLPHATSDLKQPVKLRMTDKGVGAVKPKTVLECFDETVKKYPNKPALHQKVVKKVSCRLPPCFQLK